VLSIVALAWPLLTKLREVGAWRPTHATPHPPSCPRALKTLAELLYWSERRHARELARSTHSYRLFKTPLAARLERARLQAPLRYAFASVVVSACVQSGLLPLLVVYFHRLSPAALVLNVVVGASMVVMSFAALATLLAAQLGAHAAAPFVWLTEAAGRLTAHAGDPLIAARLASFRLPEYAGAASAVYALYYLPLAALALVLARWSPLAPPRAASDAEVLKNARRVKLTALAFVSLLLVVVFHPLSAGRADGRLRVDFLDVGQGDAALVTFPDGTTLLVDGGGRAGGAWRERAEGGGGEAFERDARGVGESVVSEYLWWRGLDRVDFVVATHADSDHVEGLGDVLRNFEVGAALAGRAPPDDPEFAAFAEAARRAGVPLQLVARGDHMSVGGAEIDVLWPPPAPSSAPSRNNDSVVLRIRFRGRTILLAGDIEAAAERALVAGNDDALRADVVKVAHHGSRTSSTEEFVAATAPTFAVVSVGLDSPFGHPHESAVRRWLARGARVLTTGACGTITVSTDGDDLRMETFVSR
jgi:competence protein ComEC